MFLEIYGRFWEGIHGHIEKLCTLGDFRDRVVPVIFVFDTDGTFEPLALQFLQQRLGIGDPGPPRDIMRLRAPFGQVLEMET